MTEQFFLPQSWYPICVSREIKKKQLKPIVFNGTDWLLFRGGDGKLGMVSRFCPHMGNDLANGKVKDNCIACPLHDWHFNAKGECKKMPPSNLKPSQVLTGRLFVEEKYGLVFIFWGEKPLFEIPQFTGIVNPAYSMPLVHQLQNPYLAVGLNGFDTWHFCNVHNRTVFSYTVFSQNIFHIGINLEIGLIVRRWYDYIIKFLGLLKSNIQLDYYGGNLIMVHNKMTGHCAFLALLPNEGNETTTLYFIVALPKESRTSFLRIIEKPRLSFLRFMSFSFLKPDFPIQKNMRPMKGILTTEDASAVDFWTYWDKLPRYPMNK